MTRSIVFLSAAWRIAISCVPFLASIILGWNWLTDMMAQGTHYMLLGWYASLLGLFSIGMVAWVPLLGAAASLLVAMLLSMHPPAVVSELGKGCLALFGLAVFVVASWCTWALMWWSFPPVATEYARYDTAYFLTTGLIVGSLAVATGGFAAVIVLRGARSYFKSYQYPLLGRLIRVLIKSK